MGGLKGIYRNLNKAWALLLLPLFFLASCYYDKEDKLYAAYYANKTCDTVNVTYAASIVPILNARCATSGCHTAGGAANGNFDTYAGVKAKVDNGSLVNRTLVLMNMPSTGTPLTSCELSKIKKWVQIGAPNN